MVKVKDICAARWAEMNAVAAEFGDPPIKTTCPWTKGFDGCKTCHSFKTIKAAVKDLRRWMENRNQNREKVIRNGKR